MDDTTRFIEANRSVWDDWTAKGDSPAFFKLQRFRAGDEVLQPFELEEVGPVKGKSLLHLQCHFGMDTMAWARRGADATGVDFSEKSAPVTRAPRRAHESVSSPMWHMRCKSVLPVTSPTSVRSYSRILMSPLKNPSRS